MSELAEIDDVVRSAAPLSEEIALGALTPEERRSLVWDSVYKAQAETRPAAEAREFADTVVGLIERGEAYDAEAIEVAREKRLLDKRDRRRKRWSMVGEITLFAVIVIVVLGGLANLIYWPIETHSNDYAHVDPGTVPAQALTSLQKYFGQDDMPTRMTLVKKQHDLLNGKHAWYVLYRTTSGRKVCTYIWSGSHGDYSKVFQGSACHK